MRTLLLVRHSVSEPVPGLHPRGWGLSLQGRARCAPLADVLAAHAPRLMMASPEPKALETASLVAARLGIGVEVEDDLREHEREWLESGFEQAVGRFFAEPGRAVFGSESADSCFGRFDTAVRSALDRRGDRIAFVTHGTVMSLYAARRAGVDPFPLWKSLAMPALIALTPDAELVVTDPGAPQVGVPSPT